LIDRKYIDDHHVVARYLADRLSDEERTAFEAYYLEHPEVLAELEATARFKVGLARLRERGELEAIVTKRRAAFSASRWAIAASVALVALASVLWITVSHRAPSMLAASPQALVGTEGAPLAIVATYSIMRTRGVEFDATIDVSAEPAQIRLRVYPEFKTASGTYDVHLSSFDGNNVATEVARLERVQPNDSGMIDLYVNSAALSATQYRLGVSGEGKHSVFLLAVRR
jgi:hypothetical protein